ncbi:MAG: alpha/beta fold hydrolase [Rhodococcus sp. (in: high G+C Gram-positive bacteria)]
MTITASTHTPVDRFVETPRHRIHYVEAGSGHPIVLLHGGGPGASGGSNFAPNIVPLSERFRVIAPDMPGWGESDTSTAGGRDHMGILIDLLDALGIERVAVVGNSVGGMTAVSTAIAHPDRVSHLVTMGAPAPAQLIFAPGGGPTEGMRALTAAYGDPTWETVKRFVDVMCFDPAFATDELIESRLTAALAHPEHLDGWNSARKGAGAVSPYFQLGGQVSSISAPTMVMQGRDDRTVHFENALFLTARITDSRLVMLNRCGHWAQLEHADEFNRLLASFIGSV